MTDKRAVDNAGVGHMADEFMTLSFGVCIGAVGVMSGWSPMYVLSGGAVGILLMVVARAYSRRPGST